jgi:hypothetical protein
MKTALTLLFAFVMAFSASTALANTAANTAIVNNARLTYTGGSATATVTVTVSLVPSTPNVTITNASGAYTAPDTPALTDSVIVTSTANGPADYTVAPTVSASTNAASPSVTGGTTVSIGATVTAGTSGTTYITVPASGASGNNAAVNGIGVGSTIVFTVNTHTYTVQVISTTDNGNGTFRITWAGGSAIPATDVPGAGVQVGEQKTVNLSVLPGTIQTAGTNITVTVQAVVSTSGSADATATNGTPNAWTSALPNVAMTKYVRNVTTGVAGSAGATSFTVNAVTSTYYTAGVIGKPGDVLEYVVQAVNAAGAADLTGCAISDGLPTDYVDFIKGDYGGYDVFYIDPESATFKFTAAAVGANQASYVAPDLAVNVGAGANASTPGTIAGGKSVIAAYRVRIK